MTDQLLATRCSFCTKESESVDKIIAGPGVYICNECVDLCNSILERTGRGGSVAIFRTGSR